MNKVELKAKAISILTYFEGSEPNWGEENKDYSSKNFQGEVLLMNKDNFNASVQLMALFEYYNRN